MVGTIGYDQPLKDKALHSSSTQAVPATAQPQPFGLIPKPQAGGQVHGLVETVEKPQITEIPMKKVLYV